MSVRPMVIDLVGNARSASFEVQNLFEQALPVELRVQGLNFSETAVEGNGIDTGEIVAFPPQALIAPRRTQTCRVQYVGPPPTERSQHYYVTVSQLPVEIEGESRIQVLYNFNVLVSVPLPGVNPDIRAIGSSQVTNERGVRQLEVLFENTAPNYGYLTEGRLRIIQVGPDGRELFRQVMETGDIAQSVGVGLVGPLQRRRFTMRVTTPDPTAEVRVEYVNARR